MFKWLDDFISQKAIEKCKEGVHEHHEAAKKAKYNLEAAKIICGDYPSWKDQQKIKKYQDELDLHNRMMAEWRKKYYKLVYMS